VTCLRTSTAICSIDNLAIAAHANILGVSCSWSRSVFNIISTIVTTRKLTGDYGNSPRALQS
jgi:hypothetical protein